MKDYNNWVSNSFTNQYRQIFPIFIFNEIEGELCDVLGRILWEPELMNHQTQPGHWESKPPTPSPPPPPTYTHPTVYIKVTLPF